MAPESKEEWARLGLSATMSPMFPQDLLTGMSPFGEGLLPVSEQRVPCYLRGSPPSALTAWDAAPGLPLCQPGPGAGLCSRGRCRVQRPLHLAGAYTLPGWWPWEQRPEGMRGEGLWGTRGPLFSWFPWLCQGLGSPCRKDATLACESPQPWAAPCPARRPAGAFPRSTQALLAPVLPQLFP